MLEGMRRKGPRLYLFRPVEDLGVLSESFTPTSKLLRTSKQSGDRTQENEAEKYVIKVGPMFLNLTVLLPSLEAKKSCV